MCRESRGQCTREAYMCNARSVRMELRRACCARNSEPALQSAPVLLSLFLSAFPSLSFFSFAPFLRAKVIAGRREEERPPLPIERRRREAPGPVSCRGGSQRRSLPAISRSTRCRQRSRVNDPREFSKLDIYLRVPVRGRDRGRRGERGLARHNYHPLYTVPSGRLEERINFQQLETRFRRGVY